MFFVLLLSMVRSRGIKPQYFPAKLQERGERKLYVMTVKENLVISLIVPPIIYHVICKNDLVFIIMLMNY